MSSNSLETFKNFLNVSYFISIIIATCIPPLEVSGLNRFNDSLKVTYYYYVMEPEFKLSCFLLFLHDRHV